MVDTEEEETSHARNNKLLIEAITAKMTKLMDERFDSLRQESSTREQSRERHRNHTRNHSDREATEIYYSSSHSDQRRRRHAHEERPQEKPNWRSRSARDEANQDYYNRDDQRCFKPAKPLPNKPSIQIDYEELNKEVLEKYKALKERYKKNLSTSHVVGTKTTKEKPSGFKEELVIQNSESLGQPLPICKEPIVLEENDENSTKEEVLTQPCTDIQNQQLLSNKEEQTENKTLKHLTALEAKCTLSSTQPDFALDKLTPLEPVQPSSIVSCSQIVEEKSTRASTKEKNQLWVSTTSQAFRDNNFKTEMLPSILRGTQVSLACDFIRYWNNFTYTRAIKQPVLNVEISSIMHLIFPLRAKEDTGTFDVCNGLKRIRSTRSLTMNKKEKPPDAKPQIKARGNYLDSKKRMKANLLSLGGDCTMSRSKTFQERGNEATISPFERYVEQLPFTVTNTEHTKDLNQVSFSFSCLRDVNMCLFYPEVIEKKIGLFRESLDLNFCLKMHEKEELDKDNFWVQNETCLLLYRDPMTVIMHLLFAKGVDYNVGTEEEPPDSEAMSFNFFARTGIGVVVTTELNIVQLYVLVEMIMMLEFLARAFNESDHEVEPHVKRRNNNAQSFVLRGKPSLISFIDDSNLLFLVIGKTDLRTNLFQEGGDDMSMASSKEEEPEAELEAEEALLVPAGPMTRSRTKAFNKALGGLLDTFWEQTKLLHNFEDKATGTILVSIQAQ